MVRARPRWRTGRGRRRISVSCSMECPLGKSGNRGVVGVGPEPGAGVAGRPWPRRLHRRPAALLLRRGGAQGGGRVPRRRLQMRRAHAPRPPGRCASAPLLPPQILALPFLDPTRLDCPSPSLCFCAAVLVCTACEQCLRSSYRILVPRTLFGRWMILRFGGLHYTNGAFFFCFASED